MRFFKRFFEPSADVIASASLWLVQHRGWDESKIISTGESVHLKIYRPAAHIEIEWTKWQRIQVKAIVNGAWQPVLESTISLYEQHMERVERFNRGQWCDVILSEYTQLKAEQISKDKRKEAARFQPLDES